MKKKLMSQTRKKSLLFVLHHEEIRNMELYTTSASSTSTESSVSSTSTESSASETQKLLKNIHIIRINGQDDDNEKRVCIKRERKETEVILT